MRTVTPVAMSAAAVAALAGGLVSCAASRCNLRAGPVLAAVPAPQPSGEGHALHNIHRVGGRIISGAVPEGDAAFGELKAMGVRTLISVDGATPDVARAEARGMRYVHIPITYAEANRDQQLEIARAVRDLPGPVFVHCHHGKHRGPAAAASAAVLLGEITAAEGVAFMKTAGTASSYEGLYACVARAAAVSSEELDAAPADFPAVRRAHGFVAAMIEADGACDNLGVVREAGWKVPERHPDLVPAAEAGRLADNLRLSLEDSGARARGADLSRRMTEAIGKASALEEGIARRAPREELEASWQLVVASCKDCHAIYRDRKR